MLAYAHVVLKLFLGDCLQTFKQHQSMTIELNVDQLQTLVEIMTEDNGLKLTKQSFIEVVLDLFEDASGMENVALSDSSVIINKLWNIYIMNSFAPQSPAPTHKHCLLNQHRQILRCTRKQSELVNKPFYLKGVRRQLLD